jgi:hypothetical protein
LDRQIQSKEALLKLLQTPYQPQTSAGMTASPSATPAPQANQVPVVSDDYRLADRRTLDDLAQTLRRIDVTRQSVQTLVEQARASGGTSPSDSAALAILKTQLVAISGGLSSQLQLQVPTNANQGSVDDLQALAASLKQARAQVSAEFDTRKAAYEANTQQQIAQLEGDLRDLRAQREAADAERKQLTAARDLASDTYTALAKKAVERRVAASAAGHEVELASQATFATPAPRQKILVLVVAGVAGFLAAGLICIVRRYWLSGNLAPMSRWASPSLSSPGSTSPR